jgi:hypothetical protein
MLQIIIHCYLHQEAPPYVKGAAFESTYPYVSRKAHSEGRRRHLPCGGDWWLYQPRPPAGSAYSDAQKHSYRRKPRQKTRLPGIRLKPPLLSCSGGAYIGAAPDHIPSLPLYYSLQQPLTAHLEKPLTLLGRDSGRLSGDLQGGHPNGNRFISIAIY